MSNKKMILYVILGFIGIVLYMFLDFAYFKIDLGKTYEEIEMKKIEIQEEYGLNLESNEWKYTIYSKKTIINQKEDMIDIYNPFTPLFTKNSHVRGYITHGEEFINKVLPMFDIENEMMNQVIVEWKGIPVTVTQYVENWGFAYEMSNDYYFPYYQLDFKIDQNMYRILIYNSFDDNINGESLFYKKTNTRINEDELKIYLEFLDEIIKTRS